MYNEISWGLLLVISVLVVQFYVRSLKSHSPLGMGPHPARICKWQVMVAASCNYSSTEREWTPGTPDTPTHKNAKHHLHPYTTHGSGQLDSSDTYMWKAKEKRKSWGENVFPYWRRAKRGVQTHARVINGKHWASATAIMHTRSSNKSFKAFHWISVTILDKYSNSMRTKQIETMSVQKLFVLTPFRVSKLNITSFVWILCCRGWNCT